MGETLEFHDAANVFPLMTGGEFEKLVADIEKHGQREPIVLFEGKILDGRNRYRALQQLGKKPFTKKWTGTGSPIDYVLSANLHRRHLSTAQRAMIGSKVKPMYEKEAKKRQGTRTDIKKNSSGSSGGQSRDKAAKAVNVSGFSVDQASKVRKSGVPELQSAVETDQVSVSAAAEVATLPKKKQKEVVQEGPKAIKATAKKVRESRKGKEPVESSKTKEKPKKKPKRGPLKNLVDEELVSDEFESAYNNMLKTTADESLNKWKTTSRKAARDRFENLLAWVSD